MNCRRAQHLLFDFIDGSSNETLRAELDRHLGTCPECERFAAEMTRSLALLHRAPRASLDENFNWRVRLAIHRERNALRSAAVSTGSWARAWNLRYAVGAGVAFAVVLVAGAALERNHALAPGNRVTVSGPAAGQPSPARDVATTTRPATTSTRPVPSPARSVLSEGMLVSGGARQTPVRAADGNTVLGAIDDPARSEALIDSLVEQQLIPLDPAERERFIRRHIHRLQSRLQGQQTAPVQP